MDWVEAIGFQKEAVHTGALKYLLGRPDGVEAARALTGDETISSVENVGTEVRINGGKRPIDLAANVTARAGSGWLGVEVKVDSAWSPGQLIETLPAGVAGVLLAVGCTALAVEDDDMRAIGRVPWRCVRPGDLAGVVRDHAGGDRELLVYADRLNRESREHDRARDAVRNGSKVTSERHRETLEHWAYFSEVLRARNDAPDWERKALISGPLMTLWVAAGAEAGDYLEFMGEGGCRSLCVKTYAPPGLLRERREQLIGLLQDMPKPPEIPKTPGQAAKTCTAARFPLGTLRPADAAALVSVLVERIAPSPQRRETGV